MVCQGVMEKPPCNRQDSYDEPSACNRGLAWWKLARPTTSRRRRSFLDLSTSPAPSSSDRLFHRNVIASSEGGDAISPSEVWTSSKADTEVPSPSDDESPRPTSRQEPRSQRLTSCSSKEQSRTAVGSVGRGISERCPFHIFSSADNFPQTFVGGIGRSAGKARREVQVTADVFHYSCADRSCHTGSGETTRRSTLNPADKRYGRNMEEDSWKVAQRTAPKAERKSPSLDRISKDTSYKNRHQGMTRENINGWNTTSDRGTTTNGCKADMFADDVDCLRCDEVGLSPAPAVSHTGAANEYHAMYDILAVDRGSGFCDTSMVPFSANEDKEELTTDRIRAVAAGQGEFLARRGFAAGLVSHFLEETNAEFTVLQGGNAGMTDEQLVSAARRLEEVFVPAVRKLKRQGSTDIVLDALFEGQDDAGEFVVRFEVTITRCHPDDMEGSSLRALRDCAPAIREAVRDESVPDSATHEVVFVGRPMWELVPPVLDLSK